MPLILPPHAPAVEKSHYDVGPIDIDGTVVRYVLRWAERSSSWRLDLYDADGGVMLRGVRLVIDYHIAWRHTGRRLPGVLTLADISSTGAEASQADLGFRCVLMYLRPSELAAIEPPETLVFSQ